MTSRHFDHPAFQTIAFDKIPLKRPVFLVDEKWLPEYEVARIEQFNGGPYKPVGYVSHASVHRVEREALAASWYPNSIDRFHELEIRVPRDAFVCCVTTPGYREPFYVFVKGSWLSSLHMRPYSAFALVDAINVKKALAAGQLASDALMRMRQRVDSVAAEYPGVVFVSFADSILLKTNWFVGHVGSEVKYSYKPEVLIGSIESLAQAYRAELGLEIYAAIAQGVNEYEDTALVHQSSEGNHISLNSLGLPFAQILAIDEAVRAAIRNGVHPKAELYLDEPFFYSLRLRYEFAKDSLPTALYVPPLTPNKGRYVLSDRKTIIDNLDESKE